MIAKYGVALLARLAQAVFAIIVIVTTTVVLGWVLPGLKHQVITGTWMGGAEQFFMRLFPALGL